MLVKGSWLKDTHPCLVSSTKLSLLLDLLLLTIFSLIFFLLDDLDVIARGSREAGG